MSNEELAGFIKEGEQDKILELWNQVRRYAYKRAVR